MLVEWQLPSGLKPGVLGCQYVRAKARTLQREFFRSPTLVRPQKANKDLGFSP